MSKRARRILFTIAVCFFAGLVVATVFFGKGRQPRPGANNTAGQSAQQVAQPASPSAASATAPAGTTATGPDANANNAAASTSPSSQPLVTTAPDASAMAGLRAVAPGNDITPRDRPPTALGSLDPRKARLHVQLSRFGAGIERIEFSNLWLTAIAHREAARYLREIGETGAFDVSRMPQSQRYVLATRTPSKTFDNATQSWLYSSVPVMATRWLIINGAMVDMVSDEAWSETASGVFQSRIEDADGKAIAIATRAYSLDADFGIALKQSVRNLTDAPMNVLWQQYGPVDLPEDLSGYIPIRRLHFGYLPDPAGRPELVLPDDNVIERSAAIKQFTRSIAEPDPAKSLEVRTLWPNAESRSAGWGLSWFGTTNRYFGLAVHPPLAGDRPAAFSIADTVAEVEVGASNVGTPNETLFTTLRSPTVNVQPGVEHAFDLAIYAGPLDRHVLDAAPYDALSMGGMIIYSMGSCCSFLTFQWLAHILLWFVGFLHDFVFFDWGLAIIGLVIVVRALLHPLTKRSQINMMRFGKQMQALKPEIDKLQKKFGTEPKRMQQEQMRLMREHGVNPLQMLGCLPMFLQMPIWIALWATLYLAFDIRHQPAFYGVFQLFGSWQFLADLSSPDAFISLGKGFNIPLVGWHVNSINLLPILMGVVFFVQQKYMTPPTTGNMTPEQIQQQKIMKWMTVVLFPLMMYKSPSGLTLYIMTSSLIGIMESRYVRKHIDQLDLTPAGIAAEKAKKPKDKLARAWASRLETMKEKQREAQAKNFKKRK